MVVIPNGTLNRWDVISIWMNDHGAEKERDSKTILKKAKELEKTAARGPLDSAAAFAKFQQDQVKKANDSKPNSAETAEASVNYMKVCNYAFYHIDKILAIRTRSSFINHSGSRKKGMDTR